MRWDFEIYGKNELKAMTFDFYYLLDDRFFSHIETFIDRNLFGYLLEVENAIVTPIILTFETRFMKTFDKCFDQFHVKRNKCSYYLSTDNAALRLNPCIFILFSFIFHAQIE